MPPSGRNTTVITRSSSSEVQRHISESELELLKNLGFEEDELEMFFHPDYFGHISVEELIERYLEIAQHPPYDSYNLNWSTKEEAIQGDYNIKRPIAESTLESYYHPDYEAEGAGRSKKSHKKKRGTRKTRNKRQKRTRFRRYRTRNRRRRN